MTFREAARRVVQEGIAPSMSHQRVSQLARDDEDFPPVQKIGRSSVVDWVVAKPYFVAHAQRAAGRDSRRRIPRNEGMKSHESTPDES
ncbi:hypothetical protein ACFUJX_19925 [Streptomyces rubiginosohelvolus]|uniref:hypothetical protein n=1 Tax=Streptomyces rubiginosohelvolus TaxID=67362 RepID=UPI003631EC34